MPGFPDLAHPDLAHPDLAHDEDLFAFAPHPGPGAARPAIPAASLIAVGPEAAPAAAGLLPRLLPWIGAQAAASLVLAACVAQAMPQMPARAEIAGAEFALRLGEEAAPAALPLPAGLEDGFRLRLARTATE